MRRKNINILPVLLIIISIVLVTSCTSEVEEEEVNEKTPVTIFEVENMEIRETFMAIGKIETREKFDITTGMGGKVEKVYVEAGDIVSKGDMLFELNSETLQNNFNSTESNLRTSRDTLKIQLEDLEELLDKNTKLYEEGVLAKSQLDNTISNYNQVLKQYNNAVKNYNNQVESLKKSIEDTKVKSPIDGKIAAVYIIESEDVGSELALQVISTNGKLLETFITADKLESLDKGSKAVVYLDGDKDKAVEGEVVTLNEIPDERTGLYKVEVNIEESIFDIRPGVYGEVDFIVDIREAIVIPKRSSKKVGQKNYVHIYDDGKALEKEVKLGLIYKEYVEVLEGLEIGDKIVDLGSEYVESGEEINKK